MTSRRSGDRPARFGSRAFLRPTVQVREPTRNFELDIRSVIGVAAGCFLLAPAHRTGYSRAMPNSERAGHVFTVGLHDIDHISVHERGTLETSDVKVDAIAVRWSDVTAISLRGPWLLLRGAVEVLHVRLTSKGSDYSLAHAAYDELVAEWRAAEVQP